MQLLLLKSSASTKRRDYTAHAQQNWTSEKAKGLLPFNPDYGNATYGSQTKIGKQQGNRTMEIHFFWKETTELH